MNSPLPDVTFGPISRQQIRDYAEASGDFNEIHLNPDFAKAAGFEDVIAHGMLSMGLLGVAIENWGIKADAVTSFETKFKSIVQVGDYLTARAISASSSHWELELSAQDGRQVCTATVSIGS